MSLKLMSAVIPTSLTTQNTNKPRDSDILLKQLLECVQNCQKRFGGKTELATEFDSCVIALCLTLESVLTHGLRSKPLETVQTSTLKQVSGIVASSLLIGNENLSFWPFIKNHLTRHEQERYAVLKNINSDIGKGRAWIRSSLNERSLERYINILLGDTKSLEIYYEDWALLRDHEKNSMLPNMAAGLAAILFAISIDKAELNDLNSQQKLLSGLSKSEPVIEAPVQEQSKSTKEKKKKKVARQFISFEEDSLLSSSIPSSSGSLSSETSSLNEIQYPLNSSKHSNNGQLNSFCNMENKMEKPSNVEVKRKLSVENSGTFTKYSTEVPETLTPISQVEVGELTPISIEMGGEDRSPDLSDDLVEAPSDISAVLTAVESKNEEERKKYQEKIDSLNKENDTLKDQVNKYLSVLKMLGKDPDLDDIGELPNFKYEAEIFEKKLVQVAEMHAELMDFNVHLQQVICEKDQLLERLKTELEMLRGPLSAEEMALEDSLTNVHVWIPSAFLTGSGSDSHHVYQIFLRAGNDEWNIYRRYAQFHALHTDLKKVDPAIASYDFPPKKSIGKKDATLVESRRKRFQTYLRRILAHWPELSHCSSRNLLEQHLSFFKDQKENEPTSRNARRSNENHYTGL
ncbi:sorting nexin-29 isoform X2 [Harmonia axyridis]|uniref:sorting nexin-29 isoform X2 n=1 Tax=Harmonia axyridis TaxID=115357 RepID=UPI001E2798B9|nr:sorting nexin-29 isoform X2 [Harmonia axyridis]